MSTSDTTIYSALLFLIEKGPGRTEGELAAALFGREGCRTRISFDCRLLEQRGLIQRTGSGVARDPYRYHSAALSATGRSAFDRSIPAARGPERDAVATGLSTDTARQIGPRSGGPVHAMLTRV